MSADLTDRELLELAAKAAGIVGDLKETADGAMWLFCHDGTGPWNPLTDDGDALRLAVKLNLDILQDPMSSRSNAVEVVSNEHSLNEDANPWAWECRAQDPYAATRRAIVRAAAEIGRSKA